MTREEVKIELKPDRRGRHGGPHVLVIEHKTGVDGIGTTAVTHVRRIHRLSGPEHVITGDTPDDVFETDARAYVEPMRDKKARPSRQARRQRHRKSPHMKR